MREPNDINQGLVWGPQALFWGPKALLCKTQTPFFKPAGAALEPTRPRSGDALVWRHRPCSGGHRHGSGLEPTGAALEAKGAGLEAEGGWACFAFKRSRCKPSRLGQHRRRPVSTRAASHGQVAAANMSIFQQTVAFNMPD